ncbi:4'-phosphopantetheinyl transferase family protein [Pseudoxanthomonas dokdonensis]|uniref:4'-phosphopantetheinyl transferase family protein n=1 Tax=Pseudoxanthomonas dokdonensis TaxID=344882 RepID=UPI0009FB2B47|nr:4'-phosphopantetheinyl transferase superfamily protein [Pseudoxanthomonas dokdonensis]
MSTPLPETHHWQYGPARIWLRPHVRRQRGEPGAREVLGAALQQPPAQLPILREPGGRPRLASPLAHYDVNWSHSGDALLVALAQGHRVGVDLEWMRPRPRPRALEVARRFFHPHEVVWLESLDPGQRETGFLRLWCAKEAVLKAMGHGLSFGLHRLLLVPRDQQMTLVQCDPQLGRPQDWEVREWQPDPGYHAAVAWHASLPPALAAGPPAADIGDNAGDEHTPEPTGFPF